MHRPVVANVYVLWSSHHAGGDLSDAAFSDILQPMKALQHCSYLHKVFFWLSELMLIVSYIRLVGMKV